MKLFLAGLMQGSRLDSGIHSQDYRQAIRSALRARYPDIDLVCPFELHPTSVDYDEATGRRTLLDLVSLAAEADGLIAYVPEASMGTALEIWAAHRAGKPVWTISPLSANWVIRFLSTRLYPNLDDFVLSINRGDLDAVLAQR